VKHARKLHSRGDLGLWPSDKNNFSPAIGFAWTPNFGGKDKTTMRIDASNILNHPTPGNPNLDINSGTFGEIQTKTGNRTLAGPACRP